MIVLFTILALISSAAVSLFVVSRFSFAPTSETKVVVAGTTNRENVTLDPQVLRDVREKTVTLLDMTKKSADSVATTGVLGQAALLSTDGWAVTTAVLPSSLSQIRAVDVQGILHTISEQRIDTVTGLRYINVEHEGFRIFDVTGDIPSVGTSVPVFSFDRLSVRPLLFSVETLSERIAFNVSAARMTLRVEPSTDAPVVLVSDRGILMGISLADGTVVSGVAIRHGLPFVLSKASIVNATLPYTLSPTIGVERDGQLLPITGYMVTKVQPKRVNETVRVGDVITLIDNTPVSETALALLRFDTREQIPLTVYRDGVEMDVMVSLVK